MQHLKDKTPKYNYNLTNMTKPLRHYESTTTIGCYFYWKTRQYQFTITTLKLVHISILLFFNIFFDNQLEGEVPNATSKNIHPKFSNLINFFSFKATKIKSSCKQNFIKNVTFIKNFFFYEQSNNPFNPNTLLTCKTCSYMITTKT